MTAQELIDWRRRLGLTQQAAADRLDCGRRSIQNWERPDAVVPGYIALACAAIAHGLPPIGVRPALGNRPNACMPPAEDAKGA